MVNYLVAALAEHDVKVQKFELSTTDIGKMAMALVDAATIIIGTPTVQIGPHPSIFSATHLANELRPKLKYAAIIGSYGWTTKSAEQVAGSISNLKVEVLDIVMCKGLPKTETFAALDMLADKRYMRNILGCKKYRHIN
jgi:flavorubredoxin